MPVTRVFDPRYEIAPAEKLPPKPGYSRAHKPKVLKADFGDGYGQRAADGLNNDPLETDFEWPNITTAEKNYINDYLKARKGYQSFLWTEPDETVAKAWVCEEWSVDHQAFGVYTVKAKFRQVFDV